MQFCPTLIKTGFKSIDCFYIFFSFGAYALPGKGCMRDTCTYFCSSPSQMLLQLCSPHRPLWYLVTVVLSLIRVAHYSYFQEYSLWRLTHTFKTLPHIRDTHLQLLQSPGCYFSLRNTEKTLSDCNFFHSLDACLYPLHILEYLN